MNPDSADVIQSSDIVESRTIDWKERQDMDRMLNRWEHYVRTGKKPKVEDMSPEHQPLSFVRNFKYFILENNILYRKTVIEGEEYKQLVMPHHTSTQFYNNCMINLDTLEERGRHHLYGIDFIGVVWPRTSTIGSRTVEDAYIERHQLHKGLRWQTSEHLTRWN